MKNSIRDALIAAGVKNLKEFGYPGCNKDNILTDDVHSAFFLGMLRDNLGKGHDDAIRELMSEIDKPKKA